ncbi:acetyl-CoA carboxylase, carboxyltransferase subunit beta [Phenylobacterium sp.]|jgi:acetyl-CoA carboxylase carboxyl transferase subunit beta|uniref:acetyl-CoA carboxylase, carboxyltransferase subunit beta n=1 Tax=Phenylobacterium sp. TaxID=1871053 RepID=UPI0037C691F1
MADPRNDKPARPAPPRERRGWLSRIAPGVRNLTKRDTPDNLWVKCPETGEMLYRPDLEAALWVTPSGHHMRIGAKLRLAYTFDDGRFERIATPIVPDDPLGFPDDKPYPERLKAARKATGEQDSMAIGYGRIQGQPAVVIVQDFAFMGGSLGMAAGETFVVAAKAAVARGAALVIFTASGGARMQEGTLSLMQMARTTLALNEVKAAVLPYIVVLTDPTTGGVTASYAMLGDIHLAEPKATIGFSGRRVIEQTIRETLPDDFQRSEFLMDHGMVDQVVPRAEIPIRLGSILKTLMLGRDRLPV